MPNLRVGVLQASTIAGINPAAIVAEAIQNTDWTGLSLPAGWALNSGTPNYSAAGTESTVAPVVFQSDISGLAANDIPGSSLVIYSYDDYQTVNWELRARNSGNTKRLILHQFGDATPQLNVDLSRFESTGSIDCHLTTWEDLLVSASGKGYIGWKQNLGVGIPIPIQGFSFKDSEIDAIQSSMASDDCIPPDLSGFSAGVLDNLLLMITDTANVKIVRTILWERQLSDDEVIAVISYLGWISPF